MKLRSLNELTDYLDAELAHRKRELTTVKFLVSKSRNHEKDFLLRGGTCFLYAHWEGFIKHGAMAFLNYVSLQGLHIYELRASLVALCIRGKLKAAENANRVFIHTEITEFLRSEMRIQAEIPWADVVDTRDNLNSEVFREICCMIGVEDKNYSSKYPIIDGKLLYYRNPIAHGQLMPVDEAEYFLLHEQILQLLEAYRNDIETSALLRSYKK